MVVGYHHFRKPPDTEDLLRNVGVIFFWVGRKHFSHPLTESMKMGKWENTVFGEIQQKPRKAL